MRELITDVGIDRDAIPFHNFNAQKKMEENHLYETDGQFKLLAGAMYTPLDMTDHEEAFVGWNELPGSLPISDITKLGELKGEEFPQTDRLAAVEEFESPPIWGTGPTYEALIKAYHADVEPEEADDEYGAAGEDDYGDDYGEEGYGEEGEGEEAEYGDYGDYDEEEVFDTTEVIKSKEVPDRFFNGS
jgi:hypothetical protein